MSGKTLLWSVLIPIVLVGMLFIPDLTYEPGVAATEGSYYREKSFHSRDGIGKFYLGREIAKVMGHSEMLWLERPDRESTEKPADVIAALDLHPTDTVADIGAGTGYFSFRMAPSVQKVIAVDVQPEMLGAIDFLKTENKITNVETVLGTETDPGLPPDTIDLVLMVDAYHELAYPREMMINIVKSLKPNGRVVLVEYRRENPLIPIKSIHKMSRDQTVKEMAAVGLKELETLEFLPRQHLMIFKRAGES